MITLGTGLPGNGKTLFMLKYIADKAIKENREVFFHNINLLDVDPVNKWQSFDAEKWMDLPHGSIIVIDECQTVFPIKPNGAQLPPHYEQLAVHRHKGFDIFLITQHPTLIANFVRRLVGQHFHSVRKFGFERATVYEWSTCNPAPETISSQKSAVPLKWAYPKEVYAWYKSAEVHTVKKRIPAKVLLAVLFVFAVIGAGLFALHRYQHRFDKPAVAAAGGAVSAVAPVQSALVANSAGHPEGWADPVSDLKGYVWKETPRVVGLPQTAPKYDQLTTPTRVPVPAACIQRGSVRDGGQISCKCFTQQGTPMDVRMDMCVEFARNGFFQDFDPDKDKAQAARADSSVAVLSNRPDAAVPVHPVQENPSFYMPGEPMGAARTEKSAPLGATIPNGPPNNRATRAAAGAVAAL